MEPGARPRDLEIQVAGGEGRGGPRRSASVDARRRRDGPPNARIRPHGLQRSGRDPRRHTYALVLAARLRNRSTWPPVSTIRCVPVKNGWQTEQISVLSSLCVEPVVNVFPHTQATA